MISDDYFVVFTKVDELDVNKISRIFFCHFVRSHTHEAIIITAQSFAI